MTLNRADPTRGFPDSLPPPVVLVVGDFRKNSIGFAKKAWSRVSEVYKREGESFGTAHAAEEDEPRDYDERPVSVLKHTPRRLSPALFPIAVNDYDRASSRHFRFYLYQLFRRFNIVGVISCCTARNNEGLAEALKQIDVPILLVLDSTLSAPDHFAAGVLQLMASNSLQAQAILGQVSVLLDRWRQHSVQMFCYPNDDKYVNDLKKAIQSNLHDNEGSKIDVRYVEDPRELKIREPRSIVVCVGYYSALSLIRPQLRNCDLVLSDGFDDPRVTKRLRGLVDSYYLVRPVHKAIAHAVDAYRVLNDEWRQSITSPWESAILGIPGSVGSIRNTLQDDYLYKFVGSTNQRGGYFVEEIVLNSSQSQAGASPLSS